MSIETKSVFYYGYTVDSTNKNIAFDEGGPELNAEIDTGSYTLTEFLVKVKTALDAAGAETYTIAVDRTTQKITVSATATFSLLVATGATAGSSAFTLMGFSATDRTGAATYEGNLASGDFFEPQFLLQDYVNDEDDQELIDASVNAAADGETVETVSFGVKKALEFNLKYITDIDQGNSGIITNSASGRADARRFMQEITRKRKVEIMENKKDRATFKTILLDSTPESGKGVRYKLKEQIGKAGPGYFESGILKFRVVT